MSASSRSSVGAGYPLALMLLLLLMVTTVLVYCSVLDFFFINFADTTYVLQNRHVQTGLTSENVQWAMTALDHGHWQPLTWWSLQLDRHLYGMPEGAVNQGHYHLTNVVLHLANTVLLFVLLTRLTGAIWRSALVAGLFALHPLHVESVAWVAQRKDVLSTLFGLVTLWAYAAYAARPSVARYALVFVTFALGLMAKPMLVTLPFVLLLLDFWPLGRRSSPAAGAGETTPSVPLGRLIAEKVPLLILSLIVSLVTLQAQAFSEFPGVTEPYPLYIRVLNAMQAYGQYVAKMVWPTDLAVFYPHPGADVPAGQAFAVGALLLAVTVIAIAAAPRRPYLAVGWLWYLGTLVPVIGLIQLGDQAMADRYTYVPLIGLFIMIAWACGDLEEWVYGWSIRMFPEAQIRGLAGLIHRWWLRGALTVAATAVLAACAYQTWYQIGFWREPAGLWRNATVVTRNNYAAHYYLGQVYYDAGWARTAAQQYELSLQLKHDNPRCWRELGMTSLMMGNAAKAKEQLAEAVRLDPGRAEVRQNLAWAFLVGPDTKLDAALEQCRQAVDLDGSDRQSQCLLAYLCHETGRADEAAAHYSEALRLEPAWPDQTIRHAWNLLLAASRDPSPWTATLALVLARQACQATREPRGEYLDTLAFAEYTNGHVPQAIEAERKALTLVSEKAQPQQYQDMKARLARFESAAH